MPPPESTAGTTRRVDKDDGRVAIVHLLHGGYSSRGGIRQGEASSVVVAGGHPSMSKRADALGMPVLFSPTPTPPLVAGAQI
jgi:hypothetical protein